MSPTQTSSMPSSSSSSSSVWLLQYTKLKFFTRIRRLLQSKASRRRNITPSLTGGCHRDEKPRNREGFCPDVEKQSNLEREEKPKNRVGCSVSGEQEEKHENREGCSVSGKQRNSGVREDDDDDGSVMLQRVVKMLHFGSWEEKEEAAIEIEKMAREDERNKKVMAELGVVRVLVSMVAAADDTAVSRRSAAVRALIQLAHGTYTNKALMVEAGILSKLPKSVQLLDESSKQEFSKLLLSLSCLANTQFPVASTEILPFLIGILDSNSCLESIDTCLATLYNISLVLENSGPLVSNGTIQILLRLISKKELSEKSLAILSLLVVTQMGKRAMEDSTLVPEGLIEILTWDDKHKCQEISAYILMILAHQSSSQREKMAKAGIVPVLLEVALLGTPLAQKRAVKLLQWFKDERQENVGFHSGPQTGRLSPAMGSPMSPRSAQEGKRMMRSLVKQSLYKNMEMITRRAGENCGDGEASRLKALVISTSSKSLPY